MIPHQIARGKPAAAVLAGFVLGLAAGQASAQFVPPSTTPAAPVAAPVAEDVFGFELGRAVVDHGDGTRSVYTVDATQDYRSKQIGGKVRLKVVEKTAGGTTTHLLTINTGKYKTVAQLTATLADIFRRDLDVPAANQEIGKIGDLGHGGEIRFFAEAPDVLRYEWAAPGDPVHVIRLKRGDIQIFLGILTHPGAGG